MKSVLKLDLRTARLLHSSQSINSVSSIVKEIVENSLDAGATNVIVKLVDYGLDRIEVTDNGHGVTEEDLPLVVLPGYTSKIRRSEDLLSLATYGFRGQALAAVVAVSRVTVASGPQDSGQGLALGFDLQGNIISRKVLPWNGGTRVTVEDVFKNIPVRRKHMDTVKAKSAQLKKVQHFLHAVAIACPGVGFSLHHNKSIVWSKVPVKTMREAIGQVYGINALQGMHCNEAHDDDSGTTIKLFAPAMGTGDKEKLLCSSEPDKSIFLVNGRPVYIKELSQLLQKEFLLALGAQDGSASKHPICVASIEVSPSELDVNLEPDKTAVAFARKDSVFELFANLVKKAFSTTTPKEGTNDLTSECSTEHPSAQNECQSNLEITDNGLDHLFDDFEIPESVCEDLERQMSKELPATPDGNKENESSFAEKTVVPPTSEVELAQAVSKNVPEVQVEKTVTPTKRPVAPLRVPERQASLWSLGILQNSQGKTVPEPTRVGGGSVAEKRPMLSPAKDRTPCKKMRTPTKTLSVRGWLKDVLGTRERSAKEIFCAHRKKEILSQVPEMPLMELSECLEEEWTSLAPDEKQNYEKQAKNASSACEKPTTAQQQPRKVSGAAKHATATWKKVELQFSMKDLKECFEDYCHLSQQPPCLDTTLVGPLQGCPGDAWVVWHKARLCTLNTVRLREAVTFRRLVATFPLPSEKADPPMSLTANVLGGDSLWNTLLNMKKESRDASGTLYVTDPLLTCNGFHVRILADCKAEILQLPKDQALSELVQILKLVSLHPSPTVASSRLPRTAAVLREEATRMVRNMAPKMSRDEIEELLTEGQGDLLQELCVHNRPVCTQFFDMSTSTGSAAKDSLTQQIVQ